MNGADGLASLVLIEAVKQAAETGQAVYLDDFALIVLFPQILWWAEKMLKSKSLHHNAQEHNAT